MISPDPRILIIAPSWVGDAVLAEPLTALLKERYPRCVIDVFAPSWCAPVYARMRYVHRVIENPLPHGPLNWRRRKALAKDLAVVGYTHAFVLPNSWKSALIPYFARIPQRIGYIGEARFGLLNDRRTLRPEMFPRLVDRFAALAYPADATPDKIKTPMPALAPQQDSQRAVRDALHLSVSPAPVAVFCPGAEYGPAKRWPPEHFAELALRLMGEGFAVWLVGSPKDRPITNQIVAAVRSNTPDSDAPGDHVLRPPLHDLVGRTDLGAAVDLISAARVVVSNDSGLMHIAAALGIPLVALFGSSSPTYTPPLSPHARIARIDIECSPCFKRECPRKHFKCMRELTPQMVYQHIVALR
ncbi:MAG: lipopolysaccharide heptosyltransferase II [Proteobacteria bacterium]|nr:lipopolysaccharide heptosyltransferase II [Pseudomonadota bacterium]MCL2310482.1 lipopolysaccharide heptosyltransferase II [Pseudomonadota bacterium]